jgi:hypothetical protein
VLLCTVAILPVRRSEIVFLELVVANVVSGA